MKGTITVRALRVLALAAMAAIPGLADAQGIPMLVGTWKGTAYAVSVGSNPYRTPDTKEPNFPSDALEFTFVIREQHDSRFSGTYDRRQADGDAHRGDFARQQGRRRSR